MVCNLIHFVSTQCDSVLTANWEERKNKTKEKMRSTKTNLNQSSLMQFSMLGLILTQLVRRKRDQNFLFLVFIYLVEKKPMERILVLLSGD